MKIMAGGGVVSIHVFVIASSMGALLAGLFSIAGRGLVHLLPFSRGNKDSNLGYCYFVGVSLCLVSIKLLALAHITFNTSLILTALILCLVSLIPLKGNSCNDFFKTLFKCLFWSFVISILALWLLNIIARARGGPIYQEVAEFINTNNYLPSLNRHHGQSILAAIILSVFKNPDYNLARMAVNIWLPISQAFLIYIIYDYTKNSVKKNSSKIFICIFAVAGNCALSLIPAIPSDHDFPLLFNIYSDSVIGLGAAFFIIKLMINSLKETRFSLSKIAYLSITLYIVLASLNITSELNIVVIVASLLPILIFSVIKNRNIQKLLLLVMFIFVAFASKISASYLGGIFMDRDRVTKGFFDDSGAATNKFTALSPDNWYLPYVQPGFYKDFGNYESVFDGGFLKYRMYNEVLYSSVFDGDTEVKRPLTTSKTVRILYIIEMRLATIIKILFWPILGFCFCLLLLNRYLNQFRKKKLSSKEFDLDKSFIFSLETVTSAIITFAIALGVVFINSRGGRALFWKWALTRFNEIGILFMMMYAGMFIASMLETIRHKKTYLISLITIMMISIAGLVIRLTIYPSFDG